MSEEDSPPPRPAPQPIPQSVPQPTPEKKYAEQDRAIDICI